MPPLVEIIELAKTYEGRPIFSGLTLNIAEQGHLLITGPSGSGKSTLLRLLAGLEPANAGTIRIAGHLATEADRILQPPHRRNIGFVFQDLGLWPNLTTLGNIKTALAGAKLSGQEKRERVASVLTAFNLDDLAQRYPRKMSGGEQQRLALARALAPRPRLLLLDEPFGGVDWDHRLSLFQELRRYCDQVGATIVLVSHDPRDAVLLACDLLVLENGSICELGPLGELIKYPQSRTIRAWKNANAIVSGGGP